jgi:hypothetical protein
MAVGRKDIVNPPSPDVSRNSVLAISEGQTRINLAIVQSQKLKQNKDEVQRIINSIIASIVLDIKDSSTRILVRRALVEFAQVQFYTWLNDSDNVNKRLFNELLKRKDTLQFDTNGGIQYIGSNNSFVVNRQNRTYTIKATTDEIKQDKQGKSLDEFATPIDLLTDDRFRNVANDIKNIVPVIKDYQSLVNEQIKAFATNPPKVTYTSGGVVRKMNIRAFAEMKVRYEANKKDLDNFKEKGENALSQEGFLVWTSSHANCSKRCEVWQGKLYSLNNTSGRLKDGTPYSPLDEALQGVNKDGNGIINGYNCRHFLIKYTYGSKAPVTYTADEIKKQRAIDQSQRSRENTIRNLKSRARVLAQLGQNDKAKALLNKANMLTAKYRIFSLDNKRAYLEWRTKILPNENELNLIQNGLQVQPVSVNNVAPVPVVPPPPVKTEREIIVDQVKTSPNLNALRNVILTKSKYDQAIPPSQEVALFNQDIDRILSNSPDEVVKVLNLFLNNTGSRSQFKIIETSGTSNYDPTDSTISLNFKEHTSRTNGYYNEGKDINNSPLTIVTFHELGHKIDNEIGKAIPFANRDLSNNYISGTFVKKRNEIEKQTGENITEKDMINVLLTHAKVNGKSDNKTYTLNDFLKKDKEGKPVLKFSAVKRLLDSHGEFGDNRFKNFRSDDEVEVNNKNDFNLKLLKNYGFDDKTYNSLPDINAKNNYINNLNDILVASRNIYTKGIPGNPNFTYDIMDISSGYIGGRLGWGHSVSYMNRTQRGKDINLSSVKSNDPFRSDDRVFVKGRELELTAEFFEATVSGGKRLEAIKTYFPETYKVWYETFKGAVNLAIKGQEVAKANQGDPTFKADAKYNNW